MGLGERHSVRHTVGADRSPSTVVALAIAELRDTEPTAVEPLTESIDPGALDSLYESMDRDGIVSFHHAGLDVTVYGNGAVLIQEPVVDDEEPVSQSVDSDESEEFFAVER